MRPFLRATDRARLAPVGWVSEPAGEWAGREMEVVYDPAKHHIVMARNDPGDTTRVMLASEGYRRLAVDGRQEMWVRHRGCSADQAPARAAGLQPAASKLGGIEGHGL